MAVHLMTTEGQIKSIVNGTPIVNKQYKMIYDGNQGKGYIKDNLSKTKKYVELDEHAIKSIIRNQSSTKSIEDKLQSFISQKKSKSKTKRIKSRRKKRKKKYKRDTRKKIK